MKIQQFTQTLASAKNITEIEYALKNYLLGFGIKAYAFTYYSEHFLSRHKLPYHYASDALKPWHAYYLDEHFSEVDTTLEEYFNQGIPVYWDVNEQLKKARSHRERRIRIESKKFGIKAGVSIPVFGPNNDFVSLTLYEFVHEDWLKNYKIHQYEWLSAAHFFYHYLKLKLPKIKYPDILTKRERQCLDLTGKLWRVDKIADELHISPRTVNFHLQNANKKLGSHNKYLALYKLSKK